MSGGGGGDVYRETAIASPPRTLRIEIRDRLGVTRVGTLMADSKERGFYITVYHVTDVTRQSVLSMSKYGVCSLLRICNRFD